MPEHSLKSMLDALCDRTVDVVSREELAERLKTGRPLRVKFGIDPSGPQLHLGHAVALRKLRQFQDFGHHAILLVGDFTAQIGDPTGRLDSRRPRSAEEIRSDMATYVEQAGSILDIGKAEIVYNSTWLAKLTFADIIGLAGKVTVARMLERDDFTKRYASGDAIGVHEFLYPLGVAYDSVATRADVELGGSEQLFNLLMGRRLQEDAGQPAQICMTLPIIEGTDGVQRMGKSLNNFIALREAPEQMFGQVMSIPDAVLLNYWRLGAYAPDAEIEKQMTLPPRESKMNLSEAIVRLYHGADKGRAAREHFERTVVRKEMPESVPEHVLKDGSSDVSLAKLLVMTGLAGSSREAQRLVEQGAIKVDGERAADARRVEKSWHGKVLQRGNHQFVRIKML
jgi:tyrosyl-tRNA synthetase